MLHTTTTLDAASGETIVEVWDTTLNTYTRLIDGVQVEQRPLTPEEITSLTNSEAIENEQANKATLTQQIEDNIAALEQVVANLNTLTSQTNATINANPASYIKDLAREAKTIARQTIRIAKVMVGDLDDATVPE